MLCPHSPFIPRLISPIMPVLTFEAKMTSSLNRSPWINAAQFSPEVKFGLRLSTWKANKRPDWSGVHKPQNQNGNIEQDSTHGYYQWQQAVFELMVGPSRTQLQGHLTDVHHERRSSGGGGGCCCCKEHTAVTQDVFSSQSSLHFPFVTRLHFQINGNRV